MHQLYFGFGLWPGFPTRQKLQIRICKRKYGSATLEMSEGPERLFVYAVPSVYFMITLSDLESDYINSRQVH